MFINISSNLWFLGNLVNPRTTGCWVIALLDEIEVVVNLLGGVIFGAANLWLGESQNNSFKLPLDALLPVLFCLY